MTILNGLIEYSRRFFDGYRAQADGSFARLSELLGYRSERMLHGAGAVETLDALLEKLVSEPAFGTRESFSSITVQGEHVPLKTRDFVKLSEAGWSILFDCAVVFGATLMRDTPTLGYKIVRNTRQA